MCCLTDFLSGHFAISEFPLIDPEEGVLNLFDELIVPAFCQNTTLLLCLQGAVIHRVRLPQVSFLKVLYNFFRNICQFGSPVQ